MPDTFISYRREDSAGYAGRLREALERRLGHGRVFRDVDTLRPGDDFVRAIDERIERCRAFLAVIGQQWIDARDPRGERRLEQPDDHVRLEIATALARPDLLVVPVLVEGATMPTAGQLPESIRALAYRHAIALRDDTWDVDVDRLAGAISLASGAGTAEVFTPRLPAFWRRFLSRPIRAVAAALVLLAIVLALWARGVPAGTGHGVPPEGAGYAIQMPRVPHIALGRVVYTVLDGRIEPRGQAGELHLRVRVANEGRGDVNVWDGSFRLAVGDEVRPPVGQVAAYVASRSTHDVTVRFEVAEGTTAVQLRVAEGDLSAELPLELSPSGRLWRRGETRGSEGLTPVLNAPVRWIADDTLEVTLRHAAVRRFANLVRLTCTVDLTNRGRSPRWTGELRVRLVDGGRSVAPLEAPTAVAEPAAAVSTQWEFDAPPDATRVVLQAVLGDRSVEVPLEIP